jgi:hypothetical protein
MRQFSDTTGVEWQVFEVRRASEKEGAVTPGREGGWLAFSSPVERRRLAPFPPDWESVADDQLADLCATAERVVQRHDEFIRERRRVPRFTRPSDSDTSDSSALRGRVETTRIPDPTPAEPTTAPAARDVHSIVLQHARECRANGATVVAGMIGLRRMFAEMGIASHTDAFKNARRIFVTAFYFDQ